MIKIALFPDSLTHYRVPVFNNLAKIDNVELDVFAAASSRFPAMKAGERADCGFNLIENRCLFFGAYQVFQSKVTGAILSGKYDVVIVWGVCWYLSNWIAGVMNKIAGRTKLVFWTGGYYGSETFLKAEFRKVFYRTADRFLLYGDRAKTIMIQNGFPPERLHVIYNALNTNLQFSIYEEEKNAVDRKVIAKYFGSNRVIDDKDIFGVYVGRLQRRKKLHQAFEAIPQVRERFGLNLKLLIIGSGSELEELTKHVCELGVEDDVAFVPGIYDERELSKIFLATDFSVTPGSIGLLAMHSLAYGTPVVTHSDMAGHGPEAEAVVDGVNGFLFKKDNVCDLAVKMVSAHRLKNDSRGSEKIRDSILKKYNLQYQATVFSEMLTGLGLKDKQ